MPDEIEEERNELLVSLWKSRLYREETDITPGPSATMRSPASVGIN